MKTIATLIVGLFAVTAFAGSHAVAPAAPAAAPAKAEVKKEAKKPAARQRAMAAYKKAQVLGFFMGVNNYELA